MDTEQTSEAVAPARGAHATTPAAPAIAPASAQLQPSAEDAAARRAQLMADPAWRAAAAAGKGSEWDELQRLDAAMVPQDVDGAGDDLAGLPAGLFDPVNSPAEYDSMGKDAIAAGMELDPVEEAALRQGFHAAGVDRDLARTLHQAALNAALHPVSPADESARHDRVKGELQSMWGVNFERHMRMANDEARAIFEFLPASVKDGRTFREYITDLSLGNNKQVIQSLLMRALHRAGRHGMTR